ncbi:PH domain-containing protein [Halosegnis marinus]|uniref:PH domain-containing protein n=1 Tax=Halosegnis marinus TaxID=3034023 RepID=UPI003611A3FB
MGGSPILTTSLPGVGVGIALVVAGAWLAVVGPAGLAATLGGAALAAAGVAAAVGAYLAVVNTEYVVSDRALYAKSGIVGVRVTEAALSRVQNSAFSQDALGAAFGYGTVTFEIAGGNDVRFRRIDDPKGCAGPSTARRATRFRGASTSGARCSRRRGRCAARSSRGRGSFSSGPRLPPP